jgi:hypothetical protein
MLPPCFNSGLRDSWFDIIGCSWAENGKHFLFPILELKSLYLSNFVIKISRKCLFRWFNQTAAKFCIKSLNGFQCSWPLLGLDTPNKIFYHIKMVVHIYDMVQYHQRNKHLREILITKFDKYNDFNSKIGNKKCLPFSAHEHPMISNQLSTKKRSTKSETNQIINSTKLYGYWQYIYCIQRPLWEIAIYKGIYANE